jgi:hypothetical protein
MTTRVMHRRRKDWKNEPTSGKGGAVARRTYDRWLLAGAACNGAIGRLPVTLHLGSQRSSQHPAASWQASGKVAHRFQLFLTCLG